MLLKIPGSRGQAAGRRRYQAAGRRRYQAAGCRRYRDVSSTTARQTTKEITMKSLFLSLLIVLSVSMLNNCACNSGCGVNGAYDLPS